MAYIYKIINKINGKVYIGQTVSSLNIRWNGHVSSWRNNGKCQALYSAFDKYGIENFEMQEIEQCDIGQLNEREKYWIKQYDSYNNGYNITLGGDGHHILDYEIIYQLWDKGLTTSEIAERVGASREGIERALQNYVNYSPEEGRHRGAKKTGVTNGKSIIQYSLDGVYINTFPNATVAAESLGKGRAESNNIRSCAHGRRKTAYGYRWEFVED